ncbi:hypothetical protein CCP2SC5_2290002 [Azospirillaceae bacterium]
MIRPGGSAGYVNITAFAMTAARPSAIAGHVCIPRRLRVAGIVLALIERYQALTNAKVVIIIFISLILFPENKSTLATTGSNIKCRMVASLSMEVEPHFEENGERYVYSKD